MLTGIFDTLFGKRKPQREVSCLIATRDTGEHEVLLETRDGIYWHFPLEEVAGSSQGHPTETPVDAIRRIVRGIDGIEELDPVIAMSDQSDSPEGVPTEYHLFMTNKNILTNLGKNFMWTSDPHSKKLNGFTRMKLPEYGFYP